MNLRPGLFKVYWKLQRVIAPTLKSSQYLYEEELTRCVEPRTRWLDLGCGHAILPAWRLAKEKQLVKSCKSLVGMDYDLPSLKAHHTIIRKVRGDIRSLPFRNESFDLVSMNMVVEHLDNPSVQFREVLRILSPGGLFLFHTPNARSYGVLAAKCVPDGLKGKLIYLLEGRHEEDVFKTYYRANTEKQVVLLAEANGFKIVKLRMIVTDAIFSMVPPLCVPELMWIRVLMTEPFRSLRTNIIAIWQKVS